MRLSSLEVRGLRSIGKASLSFDDVTVLIGGNNAGKSTFLYALQLFFDAAPKIKPDDFHKRATDSIEITVTFDNLTRGEIEEFGTAVVSGKLTVSRTLSNAKETNLSYSVSARTYPPFREIRAIENKTNQRTAFNALTETTPGLEKATNADQVIQNMDKWERDSPDKLENSFVRGFFGAPNVANGKLRKKTSIHFIPAVVNVPEETTDIKRSPIIALLSEIAKQTYENKAEVQAFIGKAQAEFRELVSPAKYPQLGQISERLTSTIRKYYNDSRLLAEWKSEDGVKFSFPQPAIQVEDNGFLSGLENVGHGLQRAALFSVVEFMAQNGAENGEADFDEPQSDIILLVEEPEIYQHPHKQKLISDSFRRLCHEFNRGTGIRFQTVLATHSEKFVDIGQFHTARIVRKLADNEVASHTISALSVGDCSRFFAELLKKQPMPDHAFLAKLHIFSRELCEGFFARKIILVEGVTDKAILEGVYRHLGRDNFAEGIIVISCEGKTKMDKPFYIFNKLGIPTYAVFDSDANGKQKRHAANILLQSIAGAANPVEYPAGCFDRLAAFEYNLEGYMKQVCGEKWEEIFKSVAESLELDVADVSKTPHAVCQVAEVLRQSGMHFAMLEEVVHRVDACVAF